MLNGEYLFIFFILPFLYSVIYCICIFGVDKLRQISYSTLLTLVTVSIGHRYRYLDWLNDVGGVADNKSIGVAQFMYLISFSITLFSGILLMLFIQCIKKFRSLSLEESKNKN
jgi:hypothetical protein